MNVVHAVRGVPISLVLVHWNMKNSRLSNLSYDMILYYGYIR